jgi:hypothetical protein
MVVSRYARWAVAALVLAAVTGRAKPADFLARLAGVTDTR